MTHKVTQKVAHPQSISKRFHILGIRLFYVLFIKSFMLLFTYFLNPFHVTGLFLYPLKTSKNLLFSGVFRGYRRSVFLWLRSTIFTVYDIYYLSHDTLVQYYKYLRASQILLARLDSTSVGCWDITPLLLKWSSNTAQKMKKSLMENFIFCAVFHCVKSIRIRIYFVPYSPAFGLNTERLGRYALKVKSIYFP